MARSKINSIIRQLILLGLVLLSCLPSDEEMERQVASRFEGYWIGSYEGDDRGNITFYVTNAGNLSGNMLSTKISSSEEVLGYIQSDGNLSANTKNGFVLNAQVSLETSNGKWYKKDENKILQGTFSIKRKK